MPPYTDQLVARAVDAQRAYAEWSEPRVDALLHDISTVIADNAQELAIAAVEETGIGNVQDKTAKNRMVSQRTYASLKGKPGTGLLRINRRNGIAEYASPVGVVFGLVPKTHPVATFVFKVLIALKARNALILSCHRDAQDVGAQTGELIVQSLRRHGAPEHLVQWVQRLRGDPRSTTHALMTHPHVGLILATGGASMVRAAYASGTPAIGVGPGNAPTWVAPDANPDQVAAMLVDSKSYDNGIVCASEHNLVVDRAIHAALVAALERAGAAVLRADEIQRFVEAVFDADEGHLRPALVGQTARDLLRAARVERGGDVRVVVVPAARADLCGPLGREKLAPVTSMFVVDGDDHALEVSQALLANEGAGHTAIIHTADAQRIERFGREIPASRILVNASGTGGTFGLETGLNLSMTLGSGTFGGTSTTDSVTYLHLLNIKRVAYRTQAA